MTLPSKVVTVPVSCCNAAACALSPVDGSFKRALTRLIDSVFAVTPSAVVVISLVFFLTFSTVALTNPFKES